MARVTPKHSNESFESMFNRFRRLVDKLNVLEDIYRNEFYEKPSAARARKRAAAIKRSQRKEAEARKNRPSV